MTPKTPAIDELAPELRATAGWLLDHTDVDEPGVVAAVLMARDESTRRPYTAGEVLGVLTALTNSRRVSLALAVEVMPEVLDLASACGLTLTATAHRVARILERR